MKKFIKIFSFSFGTVCLLLFTLSFLSRGAAAPGLNAEGRLAACPDRPNCVSSEEGDIEPFLYTGTAEEAWREIKTVIEAMGGEVKQEEGTYLSATFKSAFFGFVDDVEFRMLPEEKIIHVRSASRVGYNDMGTNLDRVERLHMQWNKQPK